MGGVLLYSIIIKIFAGMAELVDALDSKSSVGNNMSVRVRLPAPTFALESLVGTARPRSKEIFIDFTTRGELVEPFERSLSI